MPNAANHYATPPTNCTYACVDAGERSRADADARSQRRPGGAARTRALLRALAETVQDRDAATGAQLHRRAGRHPRAWRSARQPHVRTSARKWSLAVHLQHRRQRTPGQTLSIPGVFFWGGGFPPAKKLIFFPPQTAGKLYALNIFSAGTMHYTYITETFYRTTNTGNWSSLSNQKGAKSCPKCTKIQLAAGLGPASQAELMRFPDPLAAWECLLLRGGRKGKGGEKFYL